MITKLVRLFVDSKTNHISRSEMEAVDSLPEIEDYTFVKNDTHWLLVHDGEFVGTSKKFPNGFHIIGGGLMEVIVPIEEESIVLEKIKVLVKNIIKFRLIN